MRGWAVIGGVLAVALGVFWAYLTLLWVVADVVNPHWMGYAGMVVSAVAGIAALLTLALSAFGRVNAGRSLLAWLGLSAFVSALVWLMSGAILSSN